MTKANRLAPARVAVCLTPCVKKPVTAPRAVIPQTADTRRYELHCSTTGNRSHLPSFF